MKSVFSIWDSAVQCFSDLVVAPSRAECMREFKAIVNSKQTDKNGQLHPYAADPSSYSLFLIGTWNEEVGDFKPLNSPEKVCTALELVVRNVTPEKELV